MKEIQIQTNSPYSVFVGKKLLFQTPQWIKSIIRSKEIVIVSDSNVYPLYGSKLKSLLEKSGYHVFSFTFPSGEASKQMETAMMLYHFLAEHNIKRSDLLIALGGGVVGDLTGFVAATYLRGINYIQIPTTLLAQIDSSVGGKTAINLPDGKNLVGAFYQPRMVLCDISLLSTLSPKILADGMAEAIKYAALFSEKLLYQIQTISIDSLLPRLVPKCIQFKKEIVEQDEQDTNMRNLLNFGHTLGHAVEKIFHYDTYTHGQAVSLGMILITASSEQQGLTQIGTTEILRQALTRYYLPIEISLSPELLYQQSLKDKKRQSDKITLSLIRKIGEGFLFPISLEEYHKLITGVAL